MSEYEGPYFVATFTEDGLENVRKFGMLAEAEAYSSGFDEGCGHYGGDYGMSFVLPNEEADMLEALDDEDQRTEVLAELRSKGVPVGGTP